MAAYFYGRTQMEKLLSRGIYFAADDTAIGGDPSSTDDTSKLDDAADDPKDEPADPPTEPIDKKRENAAAYEARKARELAEGLKKELDGYKRREEDARKEKLSESERLKEEAASLKAERDQLQTERLQLKIAAEFKLPESLAVRIIGSDEESMRADAEELAKLIVRPKAGSTTDPPRGQSGARIYSRAELAADPKLAASPEVLQAAKEGRIR